MRQRNFVLVFLLFTPEIATAQFVGNWNFGSGWVEQQNISNMNRVIQRSIIQKQTPESRSANVASLRYSPNMTTRQRNLSAFVSKTRKQDPAGAAQMEQLFASTDVMATIGQALAPVGLRVDNVADAYTVYWMSAWQASVGSTATPTRAQVTKVKQQVTQALLATPEITGASNAQKQEFAEALLVQTALIDASMEQAAGDAKQKRAIASAVRKGADAMGLDLDAMTLTEDGFVPANEGSSVDDRDIPRASGADAEQQALVDQ